MRTVLISLSVCILISCTNNDKKSGMELSDKQTQEYLIKVNQKRVRSEFEQIENYIKKRNWMMSSTETGLRYLVYEKGNGPEVTSNSSVVLNYVLSLLDGTTCYSSKEDTIAVGSGQVSRGLEEALLLMRKGDKAIVIAPSHLGYGLSGDGDKIPPGSILIYDIELSY